MKIKLLLFVIFFISWIIGRKKDGKGIGLAIATGILYAWIICGAISAYSLGNEYLFWGRILSLMTNTFIYIITLLVLTKHMRENFSSKRMLELWSSISVVIIGLGGIFSENSIIWKDALVTIEVPKQVLLIIGIIWAIGALGKFILAFIRHKSFYDELRDGSIEITQRDVEITELLKKIVNEIGEEPNAKLAFSSKVDSPITVGLVEESIFLPQKEYTAKELEFLLRHEIRHNLNRDNIKKLLIMAFCAAFWFIPFIQKSARFVAEEIEVLCDEQVLKQATNDDKRGYINLIMNDYGKNRGFSTCLSESGEGIKYRIEKILYPQKENKYFETLTILLSLAFLIFTIGAIQFVTI